MWKKAWSIAIFSFAYLLQRSHSRYTCMCIQKVHVFPPWLILYPCKNHLMYQTSGVNIAYTDRLCFPLRWICVFPRRSVWGLLTIEILLHGDNTDTAVIKGSINTWKMDFMSTMNLCLVILGPAWNSLFLQILTRWLQNLYMEHWFGELCDSIWHFLIHNCTLWKNSAKCTKGSRDVTLM